MQCSCGSETANKSVVRGGRRVAEFVECIACGRASWLSIDPSWTPESIRTTARGQGDLFAGVSE